ncbi:hypothetical protein EDB81DRAFT_844224 [Dactylonectria macrodidyma]|uniref:Uncharacterized protein n=1 Tax=Dactylonectria macrodidyma TaxID=307937 RepID=A0A9P9IW45_9HYPO|nr:hypothetical protein EDB81DRAFT_844224 [Dactylonectria macrodidyma]
MKSQDHLDPIETTLGSPMPPSVPTTISSPAELCSLEYNLDLMGKCLQIYAKVLCPIDKAQLQLLLDRTHPPLGQASFDISPRGLGKAHIMTTTALQEYWLSVSSSPAEKTLVIPNHHPGSRRSLILENASVGKDGRQTIVSTAGDVLEVNQATAGDRAVQFVGSVSNATLQDTLKDRSL